MSGMIWDELQRLKLALDTLAAGAPGDWLGCDEFRAINRAVRALEDEIAAAWPPKNTGDAIVIRAEPEVTVDWQTGQSIPIPFGPKPVALREGTHYWTDGSGHRHPIQRALGWRATRP